MKGRIRKILKESIDDMDWIRDVKTTNLDFNFDGKEYWVDISKIDIEGRKKIANYIKKTIPRYKQFTGGELDGISRGNRKGIIIHCASDMNNFEPEENLLCHSNSDSYEDDYEIDTPEADIEKSIYIDGQEILDYLSVVDDEWEPNPERSHSKQGDAGGSGGGDVNESDELDWIKGVSDQVPPMSSRKKIDIKDFIIELVMDSDTHTEILEMLTSNDLFGPSDKYKHETGNNGEGFTPEEYDDFGFTNWLEGAWLENGNSVWHNEPSLEYPEINELLYDLNGDKWVLEKWHNKDYNLEEGWYEDRYIFKNKNNGSYFALNFNGNAFDGPNGDIGHLYQVYPKEISEIIYESKLIKRILLESDLGWIKDIETPIFAKLHNATKNNNNINVYLDDKHNLVKVTDSEDLIYFDLHTIARYFNHDPEESYSLSKYEVLTYIKDVELQAFNPRNNFRSEGVRDHQDYIDLYRLIETL